MGIFGIDFDGTCVEHEYPEVGADVPHAVRVMKRLLANKNNNKLILWTMRSGKELDDAVKWFASHELPLYGVNENPSQKSWTDSPKAYCNAYIDDAAVGCPLIKSNVAGNRRVVDWCAVERILFAEEDRAKAEEKRLRDLANDLELLNQRLKDGSMS